MSARLTEEEFHTVIESIRREANISSRSGQMDRLLVAAATLKRDRAAILESERDLLAALEPDAVETYIRRLHWVGQESETWTTDDMRTLVAGNIRAFAATIANARKQDAGRGGDV